MPGTEDTLSEKVPNGSVALADVLLGAFPPMSSRIASGVCAADLLTAVADIAAKGSAKQGVE